MTKPCQAGDAKRIIRIHETQFVLKSKSLPWCSGATEAQIILYIST